jgi:dienelactone hydrolase
MQPVETMRCEHDGLALEGFAAIPPGGSRQPAVLVMHSALGLRHMMKEKVALLAEQGYAAFATDMYGVGADLGSPEAAGRHYMELMDNPDRLRQRTVAWFEAVAARDDVDPRRIAAIGYCFGGKCVLELARSGADVKAVVSYHGILTTHAPARAGDIKGEVAAYCGLKDPYAPLADIEALRRELTAASARYQITEFAEAAHGFTDPQAEGGQPGIAYNAIADRVSWAGTLALLQVALGN